MVHRVLLSNILEFSVFIQTTGHCVCMYAAYSIFEGLRNQIET